MDDPQTKETPEIEIPDLVKEYLDPISEDTPTGTDAANEEEYFKLNMEIPKTVPDYKKCIELAEIVLKEKSKDIKVATWLCFAWFRTEKFTGIKNGLSLIFHLLNKFGDNLYPANTVHRSKAIQFINTSRFTKLLEKEEVNKSNALIVVECSELLERIIAECTKLFPENLPSLKVLREVLSSHSETANSLLTPAKKETEQPVTEVKEPSQQVKSGQQQLENNLQPQQQTQPTVKQSSQPLPSLAKAASEKDAVAQFRQVLTYFFESEVDGIKKEKVPETAFVFGLSRQLQWGKIIRPPDTELITRIEAPNQIIQGKMKEWFSANDWDTLIPRVELSFLIPNSQFPYWLDLQRYVVKALEQKGGTYSNAADDIKFYLAKLLKKFPDFSQLKFKDKQTAFADPETIKWINDEVKSSLGGGKNAEASVLPPIMGEDYDNVNKEYETACSELPDKLEENMSKMQRGIESDTRRKGKFLRRLNLANYCITAKQFHLAKVNLLQLKELIDEYNLADWEPALCTAVWQSFYLTNEKLLPDADADGKSLINKEQKELFSKIAKYDGILAIKLTQKK